MKREQWKGRRDILGELFLSQEGSDGGVDVRVFVVQSQQACRRVCVNILSSLEHVHLSHGMTRM